MQTGSGALITAQTSKEQYPEAAVLADWRRDGTWLFDPGVFRDIFHDTWEGIGDIGDLTRFITSIRVGRALSTDLPEGVKQATGMAAADATIVLTGDLSGMALTKVFAPYDNALNTLAPRLTAPISVGMGMRGTEKLPQITGQVRGCLADPDNGTVTLSIVDDRLKFRTPVILPVIVADDGGSDPDTTLRPGLTGGFLIDWIARQQGFYSTPPVRAGCHLSATMFGSAWPEVGSLIHMEEDDFTTSGWSTTRSVTGPARFAPLGTRVGLASLPGGNFTNGRYNLGTGLATNTGETVFLEAYQAVATNPGTWELKLQDPPEDNAITLTISYPAGVQTLTLFYSRNLATPSAVCSVATGAAPGAVLYLAGSVTFTATGAVMRVRANANEASVTVTDTGAKTGNADLTILSIEGIDLGQVIGHVQVTDEPYSAGMWNDDFVPTAAFESSLNELIATPAVDSSDPWVIAQQIADAEQGMVLLDEAGIFHLYNRNHLSGGAAVATITTDPTVSSANLKTRASEEKTDTVRNVISVGAIPWTLDPAGTLIWELSEVTSVPANGTIRIPAEFPGPVYTLTTLAYRAAKRADGAGGDITNLTITTEAVTASTYDIVVTNPNAFAAYLVGNAAGGVHGEPNLSITGRCTRPSESTYTARRTDQASVDVYDPQPLDVPATAFRQAKAGADDLADDLLPALSTPHPVLTGIQIIGDVRLQLGDRVRVSDREGLLLDGDFWVVALETTFDRSSGLTQTVNLRQA